MDSRFDNGLQQGDSNSHNSIWWIVPTPDGLRADSDIKESQESWTQKIATMDEKCRVS